MKMRLDSLRFLSVVSALLFGCPNAHFAAAIIRADAGSAPSDIQDTIGIFQADLGGVNNGAGGGPFASGFRAINWDGVPDTSASPNSLATNFFNSSSLRGAIFSTPGSGLQVSAKLDNPSMTPVRFGNIDSSYPSTFHAFSAERLFSAVGSPIVNISFFVPGMPARPAYVAGFGAVFSDVDFGDSALIEFIDENANTITGVFVPAATNGFSFLGVFFNGGERVAKVRITCGNSPLGGLTENGTNDLVVMDDIIYAEPQALPLQSVPAATNSADSNLTIVDTRGQAIGMIIGRVRNSTNNVAGATVQLDGIGKSSISDNLGRFAISNVTASSGYLLNVSAAGYAIKRFPNISVFAGTNDLGDLQIGNAVNLPAQLRPLVPDVNPPVTSIEEGGTAYRYYQVVATDGRTLIGGVVVGLRRAGGAVVPQDGDISAEWAGSETGKPDADGLVRLRLPSSNIGNTGSTATFEVLLGATVVQTFTATVKPREYEQVWKQKVAGEVGRSAGFRVGLKGSVASELRHQLRGGVVTRETIGWATEAEIKLGYEKKFHDKGSAKFTGSPSSGSAGIGYYVGYDYTAHYSFPIDSTDEDVNLQKIYVAYAPFLRFSSKIVSLLPGETSYEKLVSHSANLVAPRRTQTAWNGHVGGYGELKGGARTPVSELGNTEVEVKAELTAEIGGFAGIEDVYGLDEDQAGQGIVFGFEVSTAAGVRSLMQNIKFNGSDVRGLNFNREFGFDASVRGRVWTPQTDFNPTRVNLEISREARNSAELKVLAWKGFELGLSAGEKVETTETLTLPLSASYNQVAGVGEVFGLMRNYATERLRARPGVVSEFFGGLLGNPYQSSQIVGYERKVYRALTVEVPLSDEVKFLRRAFGLDLGAEFERGAKGKLEAGALWKLLRLPLESYPTMSAANFPADGFWHKQEEWMRRAFPRFNTVVQRVEHFVDEVQGGFTVVRDGLQSARLEVTSGFPQTGLWINSTVSRLIPGGNFAHQKNSKQSLGGFPPEPETNQIYGVSGLVRFESTNGFTGSATLTLNYNIADITGLNESDLRIYRLGDGSNHWELIGGTIETVAHTMSATITNLGTFAIAPPLPSGDLVLSVASNTLPADGVSTSIITVSNLMLNNGQVATQLWLYSVSANGVEITDSDVTTNYSGVQLVSTNGVLRFTARVPLGGNSANISVASVAGDAAGELALNLVDNAPPLAPSGVAVSAGKSRLFVSWQTNAETDLAGYRVYYRAGVAGPPWDGTAAVEGSPSPIAVAGTSLTLRGLAPNTNYFVALVAVDTTGNESVLTVVGPLTPTNTPPQPPTSIAVSFDADGTNFLSWALSEDDGYNDRDVVRYDIYRAVFPGDAFQKIGEAPAGVGLFSETNPPVAAGNYLRYAVIAMDTNGQSSAQVLANHFLASGNGVDNDGEGMADDWESSHGLNPQDPADGHQDLDGDSMSNLAEYRAGTNPNDSQSFLWIQSIGVGGANGVQITWGSVSDKLYSIQRASLLMPGGATFTNLAEHLLSMPPQNVFLDSTATNSSQFFYRVKVE